jgi:para-nitrobenzyl esterase
MKIKTGGVAKVLAAVLAAGALFAAPTASRAAGVETPTAPVSTASGTVVGTVLPSKVQAWLGVPFAAAPVGDLRWKAPTPISWRGTYNADRKMPECIQVLRPHDINHYFGEEPTSENCLYMNVWAPPGAKAGDNLPVVVFIYGGGSTIGSSGMANYDGETMAKRGAVFVNFNYRVGILGFMAHPELSKEQGGHSGNYAYLDQNAALKWINANIVKFGGDPGKVVITGQSAGAGSVVQQTFSPLSKGLFRGAMMSSGCNWGSNGTPLADAEKTGLEIQKRLGSSNLAAMRNVPADRILAIQNETQVGVSVQGVRVGGIVDGYFMPKTQMEILKAGQVNDVPLIASFNHDEAAGPLSQAKTVAEYKEIAGKMYGKDVGEFLKLYPVSKDADVAAQAGKVARETGLERNARNCAMLQGQYAKSKTFIDTYSRKHPYVPGVKIADQNVDTIGAYHTADIPYWFGTQDAYNMYRPTRNWTAWDRELSERMSAMLIAFANTGDPSTAKDKWPAWSAKNEVKLEFNDAVKVTPVNAKGVAWLQAHPAQPVAPSASAEVMGNRIGNGPRD